MIVNFFSPAEPSPDQESTLTQVFSAGASYGASTTGAGSGVGVARTTVGVGAAVVIGAVATDAGTGDLGNEPIPMSNTTDNTIKMIDDFVSLMISFLSFFC
ncbi:hypothetical protein [Desulfitobacterium sp.]|uniref:hypothetical protein n=1 Tax=Desulfitobacterium sp. TaxID=49981 RepID=UPI002D12ED9E|nr:hypothetical protein [Desulfitobacterium sp.]HVJ48450.1 hypothetical protein [Desulfitobacterium sp.]